MSTLRNLCFLLLLSALSCTTLRTATSTKDDGKLEVVFVQVNDVYEIAPLSGGKEGGMARVATIKKEEKKANPNTFLVMSGDFVSPSVYNSLQYEGKRIRGRQMIEAMNAAGTDLAVFGNHEFDITEAELQDRINESDFTWVATNTFHRMQDGVKPFSKTTGPDTTSFPKTWVTTLTDKDGTTAKVGFIGLTLPFNRAEYVSYTDPLSTAKEAYRQLKDTVDAVVAITHQLMADDELLAKEIPGLSLILGGHEHDMRFGKVGNVYITKAHANAKSAYVVKMEIDKNKHLVVVNPQIKYLNQTVPFDSATAAVVNKWYSIAENNYDSIGFDAKNIVLNNSDSLDGREAEIRSHPTNLSKLVVNAMKYAAPEADVVIFNAGSIRIDDILDMPVTQYDLIRALPFGGGLREVDMKGSLLIKTLNAGLKNKGIGGYLHFNDQLVYNENTAGWMLNNNPVDTAKTYRVALTDFLISGKEANLEFLNLANPDIVKVYNSEWEIGNPKSDIRLAIVKYLQKK